MRLREFLKGFGSIFNIAGPSEDEYTKLIEKYSKSKIGDHFKEVGNQIREATKNFEAFKK